MRTFVATSLAGAALLGVVVSAPQTASADTIAFSSLPVIAVPAKAETPAAPEKIAATEHAEGIYAALPPFAQRKQQEEQGYHYVNVFSTEKEAQDLVADGSVNNTPDDGTGPRTCLTMGGSLSKRLTLYTRVKPYVPPKPTATEIAWLKRIGRWPPKPQAADKTPPKDTIETVHLERLASTKDAVTVETEDAFIDLQTLGTRTISKASMRLVRVAGGPNDIGIFAARDDKGQSIFLVTNPELPQPGSEEDRTAQMKQLQSTATRLVAQMPSGGSSETGCGYVRFALASKPGGGQMATVMATAFLPPSNEPDDTGPTEDQFESDSMNDEQRKMVRDMVHRENRNQRARPVAINVSLSQLASEQSPLLSVSLGWAGPDERLRF
ncbi:MAG TPA: hypothetical protein VGG39_38060 [Polyangiaceae bacterium]|jgi:hypothetical protein